MMRKMAQTSFKVKTMNKTKRKKLEAAGWKVGAASDFLNLSAEEAAFIDLKLHLGVDVIHWVVDQPIFFTLLSFFTVTFDLNSTLFK